MINARKNVAAILILSIIAIGLPLGTAAESPRQGFTVENAGGTLAAKDGQTLRLNVTSDLIQIFGVKIVEEYDVTGGPPRIHKSEELLMQFDPKRVTGITYGSDSHHRIGTGVAVGFVSLGAGLIVACTKSKKHYIGLTWDDNGNKGGMALRVDKKEYRGILAALEGVTGKKYVDTDATMARKLGVE
jgi:hypothetical protein